MWQQSILGRGPRRWVLLIAALGVIGLGSLARGTAPARAMTPGPVQTVSGAANLNGIACASSSTCVAVSDSVVVPISNGVAGSPQSVTAYDPIYGIHGNPLSWSVASFNAVTCASSTSCFAVGVSSLISDPQDPFQCHYNMYGQGGCWGTLLTVGVVVPITPAAAGGQILGTAHAVRGSATPTNTDTTRLTGVGCASATACVAVGWDSVVVPLTNGVVGTPTAASGFVDFAAVACQVNGSCYGVGRTRDTCFAEDDIGVAYAITPTTGSAGSALMRTCGNRVGPFVGIACFASTCTILGSDGVYNPGLTLLAFNSTPMRDLTCPSSSTCLLVGGATAGAAASFTPGTSPVPAQAIAGAPVLKGIACPTSKSCFAVGSGALVSISLANTWALRTTTTAGGYTVLQYTGTSWTTIPGGAVQLAVGPDGQPWVVNNTGTIFHLVNGQWVTLSGSASAIAVGADGSVWMLGTNSVPGGYGLYQFNSSTGGFMAVSGGGVRLAVGPDGQPWVVNTAGQIFHRVNGSWGTVSGSATDIAVGADGSVWMLGTNSVPGGYGLYQFNSSTGGFMAVSGGGVRLAVGPDGQPLVVNTAGQILQRVNGGWQLLPGAATAIAVG